MANRAARPISTYSDLLAHEEQVDRAICGVSLEEPYETRFAEQGAHDPTPTPFFILEDLFEHYTFGAGSHLLDVGCGTGRVLAFFLHKGCAGRATGIELDPNLAAYARAWAARHTNLTVLQGSVLDLDLSPYTDFYLFNPFDQGILQRFIEQVEAEVAHPCTLIHMSDNGDTWRYVGRPGWTELASGAFSTFRNERGYGIKVYDHPQHYTVWHYDGSA